MGFIAASSSFTQAGIEARRRAAMAEARLARRSEIAKSWFVKAHDVIDDVNSWVVVPTARHKPIIRNVAVTWGVSVEDIMGPRRTDRIAKARHHAMYEVTRLCPWMSYTALGRAFSRDHTTILHAVKYWPGRAEALGITCEPLNREPRQ